MALPYLSSGGSGSTLTTVSRPSTKLSAAGQAVSQAYEADKAAKMRAQTAQATQQAIDYNKGVTSGLQKLGGGMQNYGGGVSFGGVSSKQSSYNNGNPILRGGKAKMSIMGQEFDVPQALAQQEMYTTGWNEGRYTPMEGIGRGIVEAQAAGRNYMDFGGITNMVDKYFKSNPGSEVDRPMNRKEALKEQQNEVNQRIAQIEQQGKNRVEYANPFGITNDGGWANMEREMARLREESRSLGQDISSRRDSGDGGFSGGLAKLQQDLQNYVPTTSNLPISERYL